MMKNKVVIVGGGPVGLLTALYLAQRKDGDGNSKYPEIIVVEKREDPRQLEKEEGEGKGLGGEQGGLEYNVVISYRGLEALKGIDGLVEELERVGVRYNRMQNCLKTDKLSLGYVSITESEKLSIGRNQVVKTLLNFIEKVPQITVQFSRKLVEVDFKHQLVTVTSNNKELESIKFDILLGTDGAKSNVAYQLRNIPNNVESSFSSSSEPYVSAQLNHTDLQTNKIDFHTRTMYTVQPSSQGVSLILLPNRTTLGAILNFECQLDNPNSQGHCLHTIKDSLELSDFFHKAFPTLGPVLYKAFAPRLGITSPYPSRQPLKIPQSTYLTTRYSQFHHPDLPILILGDAAHTMPPTVGQGINCGFVDVQTLDDLLDCTNDNWSTTPHLFNSARVPEAHAIQTLSQLYLTERQSPLFGLRLGLDIGRSLLRRRLPQGWVQPSVNQLLSQTNLPYTQVLRARHRHLLTGGTLLLGTLCSLTAALVYQLRD